jgi:hypothetical protein
MGHILSLAIFEKLSDYDNNNQKLDDFIQKFIIEIDVEDVEKEIERWEKYK